MKANKHHNRTLLQFLNDNKERLDSLLLRKHSKDATEEWKFIMDSHWEVERWLIEEVIKPALEEALINQELHNF